MAWMTKETVAPTLSALWLARFLQTTVPIFTSLGFGQFHVTFSPSQLRLPGRGAPPR
jgi:hypothetical protein